MKILFNFTWFILHLFQYKILNIGPRVNNETFNNRIEKCYSCKNKKEDGILCKIKGPRCNICGCFIHYKSLYVFESCPDNIW